MEEYCCAHVPASVRARRQRLLSSAAAANRRPEPTRRQRQLRYAWRPQRAILDSCAAKSRGMRQDSGISLSTGSKVTMSCSCLEGGKPKHCANQTRGTVFVHQESQSTRLCDLSKTATAEFIDLGKKRRREEEG